MSRESYVGQLGSLAGYRGYTVTDYQEEDTPGTILGADNMIVGAFVRPKPGITATQPIMGTIDFAGSAGWQLRLDGTGTQFGVDLHDGAGGLFSTAGVLYNPPLIRPQWHLVVARIFATATTDVEIWVNGSLVSSGSTVAAGMTVAGANPFRIGFNSSFNDIADACDIGPLAYFEGVTTPATLHLGIDQAMKRRTFIADSTLGINWSNIWSPRVGQGGSDNSYFTRNGLTDLNEVGSALARTSPAALYA